MMKRLAAVITVLAVLAIALPSVYAEELDARNDKLLLGDRDKYVLELQNALHDQGYLKVKPTGYYGTDTEAAVMAFQKAKGLKVDGKAGPVTRKALLKDKYTAITEKRDVADSKPTEADGTEKIYPGDKGTDVEKLQRRLKELGYYTYSSITGYFGPVTEQAVASFQRAHELGADGIVGAKTGALLNSDGAKPYVMSVGDKGDDVVALQKKLIALKYYDGKATGYYGTTTQAAVKLYQKANGLSRDGKAGKNTLLSINSSEAKKNTGDPVRNADAAKTSVVDKYIAYAKEFQGRKYVLGGNGPNVFDCSGYVRYVMKSVGVNLPRTSYDQSKVSKYKTIESIGDLKKGDLMFFKTTSSQIGHAGIYLGGGKFIHAAPGVGVKIESLVPGRYYHERFRWGKRVF